MCGGGSGRKGVISAFAHGRCAGPAGVDHAGFGFGVFGHREARRGGRGCPTLTVRPAEMSETAHRRKGHCGQAQRRKPISRSENIRIELQDGDAAL